MIQSEIKQKTKSKKLKLFKVSFLILYTIFLFYLYFILIKIENNPIVVVIILVFLFLVVSGLIVAGTEKLSKLFQSRKKPVKGDYQRYKELLNQKIEPTQKKNTTNISLEFNYRKPLIHKCSKCGMILSSFSKKCPQCGKIIQS